MDGAWQETGGRFYLVLYELCFDNLSGAWTGPNVFGIVVAGKAGKFLSALMGCDVLLTVLTKQRSVLAGDLEGFEILTDSVVDRMRRNRERFWLRFFLYES